MVTGTRNTMERGMAEKSRIKTKKFPLVVKPF